MSKLSEICVGKKNFEDLSGGIIVEFWKYQKKRAEESKQPLKPYTPLDINTFPQFIPVTDKDNRTIEQKVQQFKEQIKQEQEYEKKIKSRRDRQREK